VDIRSGLHLGDPRCERPRGETVAGSASRRESVSPLRRAALKRPVRAKCLLAHRREQFPAMSTHGAERSDMLVSMRMRPAQLSDPKVFASGVVD
jgi:hypothetical protein